MATEAERRQARENRLVAMSHPLRSKIFLVLNDRVASPVEIARELGADSSLVSYHAKRLVKLNCAELVKERKVRGATEHFYRATERHLVDTDEWDELHPAVAEELVGDFMQAILDDFVASVKAKMIGSDPAFVLTRTPIVTDLKGRDAIQVIHERAELEMLDVQAESVERMLKSGEEGLNFTSALAFFEIPTDTIT